MRIAILSNVFKEESNYKEIEEDLAAVGNAVKKILEDAGHEAIFFDVNERTFEELRHANVDIAFNVCERFNGSSLFEPHIASMLELLNIPYTGSGPLTLATCINKARVKEILMHHGILTPNYQVFYSRNKKLDPELKFPLIVKPVCMDNSIGITKDSVVHNEDELRSKVGFILRTYDQPALVEEFIDGREITVGILGNGRTATVLPPAEIDFGKQEENEYNVLGYESKWYKDWSKEDAENSKVNDSSKLDETNKENNKENENNADIKLKCPSDLPKYQEYRIKRIALQVYNMLGCRDYGRVDFRLSKEGVPYVLEMNPNPGLSPIDADFIPLSAEKMGMPYDKLILKIFEEALDRHDMTIKVMPSIKSASTAENISAAEEKIQQSGEVKDKPIKVEPDIIF